MRKRFKFSTPVGLLVSAICAGCAGCGGGGGSSPSTGTPVPPVPPPIVEPAAPTISYAGNSQSIAVTQSNAAQLAYRAFQLRAVTQLLETFWVDPPQGAVKNTATNIGQFSGTVDLSTEVDSNGRGYVEAVFQNFSDDPDVFINGRYLQSLCDTRRSRSKKSAADRIDEGTHDASYIRSYEKGGDVFDECLIAKRPPLVFNAILAL